MPWPTEADYAAAIAAPASCFRDPDLAAARVSRSVLGSAGVVYRLEGAQTWGVKCFLRPATNLVARYLALRQHLGERLPSFLVDFAFLPQGIKVSGQWYPIVKMTWIDGEPLSALIARKLQQPQTLTKISRLWLRLARDMHDKSLAHGDLHPDNVLVTAGKQPGKGALRLVDYDVLWKPGLEGLSADEAGHPAFQHPGRGGDLSLTCDRFGHLAIYTALRALAERGSSLRQREDGPLLFCAEDFAAPARSSLLRMLWEMAGDLRTLAGHLILAATRPYSETSPLAELVSEETVRPLENRERAEVAALFAPVALKPRLSQPGFALEVLSGPETARVFPLNGHDTFIAGRSRRAHLRLPKSDQLCSRFHFLVEVNPPRCIVLDLESRNGTFVNDKRITQLELCDGDQVKAGSTLLRVHMPGQSGSIIADTMGGPLVAYDPAGYLPAEDVPPTIPGFTIERKLGRGGMGVVYLASRTSDGKPFAIKTIHPTAEPSPQDTARFLREAEILRQLQHPHIVACHDIGRADPLFYFAMDYIQGHDAAQLLKSEGPLRIGRAVRLIRQVLAGLQYAHERGYVHRDIKPGNLLIEDAGQQERVLIADFGLAKLYQSSQLSGLTMADDIGGTIPFMPPEQILSFREALPASDQYSAAATLYNLLTNRFPHGAADDVRQQLTRILNEPPLSLREGRADVPEALETVVLRAMNREPESRWPDCAAFARALQPFEA